MTLAMIVGTLALIAVALLLGATWYEAVVMAPNYERDVPASIALARQFLQRTTPAHYFRVVAPLAQVLTLVTLIAAWNQPGCFAFLVAFVLLIVADVITYTFHYPRLAIMFKTTESRDAVRLKRAAHEWAIGNWVRGVLLVVVLVALVRGVSRLA